MTTPIGTYIRERPESVRNSCIKLFFWVLLGRLVILSSETRLPFQHESSRCILSLLSDSNLYDKYIDNPRIDIPPHSLEIRHKRRTASLDKTDGVRTYVRTSHELLLSVAE